MLDIGSTKSNPACPSISASSGDGMLSAGRLPATDITGQRVGAPIARPGAVPCIGQNHVAHAAESGAQSPTSPIPFYKSPNTVIGSDDTVLIPRGSTHTDWEVELGVAIGRRARYLESADDALSCVAGYVIANDVSERGTSSRRPAGSGRRGRAARRSTRSAHGS